MVFFFSSFLVEKLPSSLDDLLTTSYPLSSIIQILLITLLCLIILSYFLFSSTSSSHPSTSSSSLLTSPFLNRKIPSPIKENIRKIDELLTTYSEYNDDGTIITENHLATTHSNYDHVIIEPPEKKWLLQSRVANVKTPNDIFAIFDEFDILHKLKLPVRRLNSEINQLADQAFRDLVRDKININDEPVKVDDAVARSPELYRSYFHNRIKEAISDHISDLERTDKLSLYLCCHLSRTRAGGDTLFAVKDIFDSPQVIIMSTISHVFSVGNNSISYRHTSPNRFTCYRRWLGLYYDNK